MTVMVLCALACPAKAAGSLDGQLPQISPGFFWLRSPELSVHVLDDMEIFNRYASN
jgi:hypothetical protein